MAQIKAIYRTSDPESFIVTRNIQAYRTYANNLLKLNFETAGEVKIGKKSRLVINGVKTAHVCWGLTFVGGLGGDGERFIRNLPKMHQLGGAMKINPLAAITSAFAGGG